jgi:transposase
MSTEALPLPDLSTLPDDPATLRQLVLQLLEALRGKDTELSKLQHHMDLLLRRLYGRSSEKIDPLQLLLFAAAAQDATTQQEAATPEPAAVVEPEAKHDKRPGHGRRPKPDHLKRVDVIHDLTEAEKQALAGDGQLILIGEEVTEQYEWEPSSLYVVRHIQKKYARKPQLLESGAAAHEKNIITAPKPPQPIPGGIAGPGLIAEVVTNRFVDHLPFHRQERRFGRHGCSFSRQTTDAWALDVAERWFAPLVDVLLEEVLASGSLNTDDTPVNVRDAHGKKRYQGRFWTYIGDDLHPHTVLRYTPNHTRDGPGGPADVLQNYVGFVQADAFSGYDAIYLGSHGRIVEVACWAHARRKFFEAQSADRARAEIAIAHIAQLYAVEKELRKLCQEDWRELDRAERFARIVAERQARSLPVLKQFGAWLEAETPRVLPKSPLRAAMEYTRNNWTALNQYAHHGHLTIDNNAAERALRGIAIGRRNWLFLGSDRGGRAAAVHFSLIASCLRNNVEPFAYLRDLLTRLPTLLPGTSRDALRPLLPDCWKPAK